MFKTAHFSKQNRQNLTGNAVSDSGTPLANSKSMFRRFTFKEFSLVVGIVVAIILLALWFNPRLTESLNSGESLPLPKTITPSAKVLAERVISHIQDSLR